MDRCLVIVMLLRQVTDENCVLAGSLCCDSAEEAKTLIPSIAEKIDDDTLQELLDQMAKLQG